MIVRVAFYDRGTTKFIRMRGRDKAKLILGMSIGIKYLNTNIDKVTEFDKIHSIPSVPNLIT